MDKTLIEKSKKGDLNAFEQLVRRYENKVFTLGFRFTGNYDDACDVAQEAFLRLYQSLPQFRGDSDFMTWFYRIIANVCRDETRRRRRYNNFSLDDNPAGCSILQLPDRDVLPEEALEKQEFADMVQKCLDALSEEHRLVLIMRDIQGLSYDEMAEALNSSLGTVKSRLNRARKIFKEKIIEAKELFEQETRLIKKGGV